LQVKYGGEVLQVFEQLLFESLLLRSSQSSSSLCSATTCQVGEYGMESELEAFLFRLRDDYDFYWRFYHPANGSEYRINGVRELIYHRLCIAQCATYHLRNPSDIVVAEARVAGVPHVRVHGAPFPDFDQIRGVVGICTGPVSCDSEGILVEWNVERTEEDSTPSLLDESISAFYFPKLRGSSTPGVELMLPEIPSSGEDNRYEFCLDPSLATRPRLSCVVLGTNNTDGFVTVTGKSPMDRIDCDNPSPWHEHFCWRTSSRILFPLTDGCDFGCGDGRLRVRLDTDYPDDLEGWDLWTALLYEPIDASYFPRLNRSSVPQVNSILLGTGWFGEKIRHLFCSPDWNMDGKLEHSSACSILGSNNTKISVTVEGKSNLERIDCDRPPRWYEYVCSRTSSRILFPLTDGCGFSCGVGRLLVHLETDLPDDLEEEEDASSFSNERINVDYFPVSVWSSTPAVETLSAHSSTGHYRYGFCMDNFFVTRPKESCVILGTNNTEGFLLVREKSVMDRIDCDNPPLGYQYVCSRTSSRILFPLTDGCGFICGDGRLLLLSETDLPFNFEEEDVSSFLNERIDAYYFPKLTDKLTVQSFTPEMIGYGEKIWHSFCLPDWYMGDIREDSPACSILGSNNTKSSVKVEGKSFLERIDCDRPPLWFKYVCKRTNTRFLFPLTDGCKTTRHFNGVVYPVGILLISILCLGRMRPRNIHVHQDVMAWIEREDGEVVAIPDVRRNPTLPTAVVAPQEDDQLDDSRPSVTGHDDDVAHDPTFHAVRDDGCDDLYDDAGVEDLDGEEAFI